MRGPQRREHEGMHLRSQDLKERRRTPSEAPGRGSGKAAQKAKRLPPRYSNQSGEKVAKAKAKKKKKGTESKQPRNTNTHPTSCSKPAYCWLNPPCSPAILPMPAMRVQRSKPPEERRATKVRQSRGTAWIRTGRRGYSRQPAGT